MDILLADDEKAIAVTLKDDLEQCGHLVTVAADGLAAKAALESRRFDVLISDIKMPGLDGMELLPIAKRLHPEIEVIMITGYGTIESAVQAMKKGAFEYLLKPFYNEEIVHHLRRIAELRDLRRENVELREELSGRYRFENIIGRSKAMQEVFRLIRTVAPSESNVLIEGASGTGKELIAKAIHHNSLRRNGPFVAFSCAEMTPTLLEDSLFGHERGAFTDAKDRRKGLFERAQGGTLFLDEIDDTPMSVQVKLLRVLQERQIERLGGEETVPIDVRLVAATKVDLGQSVVDGEFRPDLYYRLNVVPLRLPPLRDREGDVRLLVLHFLARYGGDRNYTVPEDVLEKMERYSWPGNVRQLENAVERAIALAGESLVLKESHLLADQSRQASPGEADLIRTLEEARRDAEIKTIRAVLTHTGGHKAEAAKILGVSRKNLWEKMKDYGLEG
ncbi:MAG: sigma-54 dependent transcriptional regulator [Planctomycetes bacterium]|nr:sigma-54 dependent transcriptional regulator [Planctomycetota bacterium]